MVLTNTDMKVGFGSYAFRWSVGTETWSPNAPISALEFLQMAKNMGAETVQLCDNLKLEDLSGDGLDSILNYAEANAIELEVGMRGSSKERILKNLEISKHLNSNILRIVPESENTPISISGLGKLIDSVLSYITESGITLCVENHFTFTPYELSDLVKNYDQRQVAICYDVANSISQLYGVYETLNALLPYTRSVHIKNVTSQRNGTGFYIKGCSLEEGIINLSSVIQSIKEQAPDCNIYIESWIDALPDKQETISNEINNNQRDLDYLKTLI